MPPESVRRRVLVTGAAGFIGASLALGRAHRHADWDVVALDNLRRRSSELNLPRLRAGRRKRKRHAEPARGRAAQQPGCDFTFCSTNKVYGDLPNALPLQELDNRLELTESHRYYRGIDTTMSIDGSTHSLFGVSKAAADLLVQEYGRYFDMATVCFRGEVSS